MDMTIDYGPSDYSAPGFGGVNKRQWCERCQINPVYVSNNLCSGCRRTRAIIEYDNKHPI